MGVCCVLAFVTQHASGIFYALYCVVICVLTACAIFFHVMNGTVFWKSYLTFWRRNYFLNFSTPCIYNVNRTGTKYIRIMKQTAF